MTQRKVHAIPEDELFTEWQADVERIKDEVVQLFSMRRIFRDVMHIFDNNERLRDCGGHVWDWMRVARAHTLLVRLRREGDKQGNTVCLNRLLGELEERPEVVSRRRVREVVWQAKKGNLFDALNRDFTNLGIVRPSNAEGEDYLDPQGPARDRRTLMSGEHRHGRQAQGAGHRGAREERKLGALESFSVATNWPQSAVSDDVSELNETNLIPVSVDL